ncbi:MAG: nucleotidyltransferase domain-containing protein [Candidatus Doudnabacteria bacterium]|nr:nucleotidyltransferase domain-containing protein [Candidatus Doudnabacteria bacterium]
MKLEYESEKFIRKEIMRILGRNLNLSEYRVFFFGSRVNGKSVKNSDIDVGIEGRKPLPAGVLSDIRDEISELPVLYKIDIVDFANVNEKFKAIAKEHIELVN